MPLTLTDAERTRWPRRSTPAAARSSWERWRRSSRRQARVRSGRARFTEPRAPFYQVSGRLRRISVKGVSGLGGLGASRAAANIGRTGCYRAATILLPNWMIQGETGWNGVCAKKELSAKIY
jgi:hypothetical protein